MVTNGQFGKHIARALQTPKHPFEKEQLIPQPSTLMYGGFAVQESLVRAGQGLELILGEPEGRAHSRRLGATDGQFNDMPRLGHHDATQLKNKKASIPVGRSWGAIREPNRRCRMQVDGWSHVFCVPSCLMMVCFASFFGCGHSGIARRPRATGGHGIMKNVSLQSSAL
ncbi:hypothetical protein EV126DRAFT_199161 [Verticillium dahliae]|nr:hypothetical protein EV126DRAFT_199161 [Verticillium dahliae]